MMIDAVSYLKDACTTKVCLMEEIWAKQIHKHRYFLNVLRGFDLIVLYSSQSVKSLGDRIGRRCVFVPPGIDSIHFCPYPANPERVVDVYSIGRRSQATHQAILKMVDERGIFYLHDTIEGNEAINPINRTEHRSLFANIAKSGLQARIEALIAQGIPPHEHNTRKEVHSDAECLGATRPEHSAEEFGVRNLCHATRLGGVLRIPPTPNQSHAF